MAPFLPHRALLKHILRHFVTRLPGAQFLPLPFGVLIACSGLLACDGNAEHPLPPSILDLRGMDAGRVERNACDTPNAGCPCADDGELVACGTVKRRSADYLACSEGKRSCNDGTWGECVGNVIAERKIEPSSSLQALGASTLCADNPCDPYCNNFVDDSTGLTTDGGLGLSAGGGLTLLPQDPGERSGVDCTALNVSPDPELFTVVGIDLNDGLNVEYFNQRGLEIPAAWTPTHSARVDTVNFDWGVAAPSGTPLGTDNFSVRFHGQLVVPLAESYTFCVESDDGTRLWLGNQILINDWNSHGLQELCSNPVSLTPGTDYPIRLEYFDNIGSATVRLRWQSASVPKQIIPTEFLKTSAAAPVVYTVEPPMLQFGVEAEPAECESGPLTAAWAIDKVDIASVDQDGTVSLAEPVAGPMTVTAYVGALAGSAAIDVVVDVLDSSGAPAGAEDDFAGDPVSADVLVPLYPYEDTIFPLGLRAPLIQWDTGGTAASAVKVGLVYPSTGTPVFRWERIVEETVPPRFQIPQQIWELFERTAVGAEAAYTIERVVGGTLREGIVRPIRFAEAPLRGRIVYTEYARGANNHAYIMSVRPGSTARPQSAFPDAPVGAVGDQCPVCHTVSANGQVFATSNYTWSGFPGISTIDAEGAFTNIADFDPPQATLPPNPNPYYLGGSTTGEDPYNDRRGFAWAPLTPNGDLALVANNFWGNTKRAPVGIDTTTHLPAVPSSVLSGGNGNGLRGEYYSSYTVPPTTTPWQRADGQVYFDWPAAPVGIPTVISGTNFYARWTGEVQPYFSEPTTFSLYSGDGVRLTVNGVVLIDELNHSGPLVSQSGTITLEAGRRYPIVVEHRNNVGGSHVELRWMSAQLPLQVVPQTQLYWDDSANGVRTSYYNNANLTAPATFTRVEPEMHADFGAGAARQGMNVDNFSALWEARVQAPYAGNYNFCVTSDDGVRLFLDGVQLINAYVGGLLNLCSPAVNLAANTLHTLRVEYLELGGNANISVEWQHANFNRTRIPSTRLFLPADYTQPSTGLRVTYYNSNSFNQSLGVNGQTQAPNPVQSGPNAVTRIESNIDNDWLTTRPQYSRISSDDNFSARYSGELLTPVGCDGLYVFRIEKDDGASLFLDDFRVAHYPSTGALGNTEGAIELEGGQSYRIKVDYREGIGNARVRLLWDTPCAPGAAFVVIPSAAFLPANQFGAAAQVNRAGYVRAGGDNGNNYWYYVWDLPAAVGEVPLDVTAATAGHWGLSGAVMMVPSFAPDNSKLVFVDGDSASGAGWRKGLSTFDFDAQNQLFHARRLVVNHWPFGDVIKWPTFESDSRSVIYQTSHPGETCCINSHGNNTYGHMAPTNYFEAPGVLWSVDTEATEPTPVALGRLNSGEREEDSNKSYQPTMLPQAAAGYRWVVFTSTRPYGNSVNTANNNSYADVSNFSPMLDNTNHQSMLWVAAIDDEPSDGVDRSHPPFFLPNQNYADDPTNGYLNERGFWTLESCRPVDTASPESECDVDEDCCGGSGANPTSQCRLDLPVTSPATRHCTTVPAANSCGEVSDSCLEQSECCAGLACVDFACAEPPPLAQLFPGNFERVYEAECQAGEVPVWHFFDWQAETPPTGSFIEFYAQTAAHAEELLTLPESPTLVTTEDTVFIGAAIGDSPPGWEGSDVAAVFSPRGIVSRRFLKITMRFQPNQDRSAAPTIANWRQAYSCLPGQ